MHLTSQDFFVLFAANLIYTNLEIKTQKRPRIHQDHKITKLRTPTN